MWSAGWPTDPLCLWWSGFPVAFVLTCVTELPAYLAAFAALGWCRRGRGSGVLRVRTAVAVVLALNLLTHPVLWAVAQRLSAGWSLVLAEVAVVAVEGLLVFAVARRLRVSDPVAHRLGWSLLAAALANACSVLVGVLVLPMVVGSG